MSRRSTAKIVTLAATLAAGLLAPARATAMPQESPQHFAIELKLGPYVPHLDSSAGLNGRTPFADQFGSPTSERGALPSRGLLTQGEFDYQFFSRFGTLGVGISGGYYSISAPAFTRLGKAPGQPCTVIAGEQNSRAYQAPSAANPSMLESKTYEQCISGDTDKLNVVPLSLMLVYRFDVLDKRLHVPLIPYIKVGLGYYVWWFGSSDSFTANVTYNGSDGTSRTEAASGASMGVVIHPGIALNLSALDPHAGRVIDQEIGINRVSAFVELNAALVDGFGRSNKLNLSDTTLNAGLNFEF